MFKNQKFNVLLFVLAMISLNNLSVFGQKDKNAASKKLRDVKYSRVAFKEVLADFARAENIPMSVVIDSNDDRSISFATTRATIEDVFDAIIRAKPNYVWKKSDGMIRFYPKNNQNQSLQNLFKTKISKISIEPNTTTNALMAKIFTLPEVMSSLSRSGLQRFAPKIANGSELVNGNSALEFADLILGELLDKIVKQSKAKFWSIEVMNVEGQGNFVWLEFH